LLKTLAFSTGADIT